MMRVSHVTIGKTWSRRQHGVLELWTSIMEDFLNFIFIFNCCILSSFFSIISGENLGIH